LAAMIINNRLIKPNQWVTKLMCLVNCLVKVRL